MASYILRRLLLIIPTLFGIMVINFAIVQLAPGGPIEQIIARLQGTAVDATARIGGSATGDIQTAAPQPGQMTTDSTTSRYRGARGLDPYFRDQKVVDLVAQKLPVSVSLGLWTTLLIYLVSIPLGIRKAIKDGSSFDVWTSAVVIVGYAIPGFLFAVLLIVVFAGGSYLSWFPLRGIVSDDWANLPWYRQVLDYFWHLALPVAALLVGGFASLTMLTKNSFLEEINKQYVTTARAKGLTEGRVLYGHVFRNAMLIVIAGFPAAFVHLLFTSNLLIEVIFSLDGLGLQGYEAAISRDYPLMFGTLYFFTLLGLVMNLIGDLMYVAVDPRIDFEGRS